MGPGHRRCYLRRQRNIGIRFSTFVVKVFSAVPKFHQHESEYHSVNVRWSLEFWWSNDLLDLLRWRSLSLNFLVLEWVFGSHSRYGRRVDQRMIGVLESDETIGVLNFKVNVPGLLRVSGTIPQNEKSSNRRLIERKKMGWYWLFHWICLWLFLERLDFV